MNLVRVLAISCVQRADVQPVLLISECGLSGKLVGGVAAEGIFAENISTI